MRSASSDFESTPAAELVDVRENAGAIYRINLLGPFRLFDPNGQRIEIPSKKAIALIAMVAMAHDGERSRVWLQDRLWGSRERPQAQSSLRRELSLLRKRLNRGLFQCDHQRVRLDLRHCWIDARALERCSRPGSAVARGEFLEGLDIAAEEEFEAWLREQRCVLAAQGWRAGPSPSIPAVTSAAATGGGAAPASTAADPLPVSKQLTAEIVDLSQPAPGFGGAPALAVLRFSNHTGDPANDFLAEGLSEDLIDRLSRLRWLPVISRGSSFSMTDKTADPKVAGRRLGARYAVEGRLRHRQNGLSVAASLIDTESGFTLWSHPLHRTIPDSQNALDRLTSELVAALDSRIDHAEQRRAACNPLGGDKDIRDLIWRGRWHLNRLTKADAEAAHTLLARALELDPNSIEALIQATFSLGWSIWVGRKSEPHITEMRKLAQRAIVADGDDGRGYMLAGIAEMWLRRTQPAQALLRMAIQLNPSLTLAHAQLGSSLLLAGEPEAALRPLKTALRLSPNDVHVFYPLSELAMCYVMLRRWSEAIEHADQALIRRPAYWHAHLAKISALAWSGDLQGARNAAKTLSIMKPNLTSKDIDWLPFADRTWIDLLIDVFEMTGGSAARASAGETAV